MSKSKSRQRDFASSTQLSITKATPTSSTIDTGQGFTIVISVGPTDQMRSLTIESSERFLTTEEAAEFLRVPKQSLLNMVSQGLITPNKLGQRNRYKTSDLTRLLLAQKTKGEYDDNKME